MAGALFLPGPCLDPQARRYCETVIPTPCQICVTMAVATSVVSLALAGAILADEAPWAVSTFNCIGLYWSPLDGAPENVCLVKYRRAGSDEWKQALPLWFDARQAEEVPVEHRRQYRGSIVNLTGGTWYEIELFLQKTQRRALLYARTWDEHFLIGAIVTVSDDRTPLVVDRSGSPQGYILYTPAPGRATATIDVRNTQQHCVEVRGSYVILRGLTLKNAQEHGIRIFPGCHDIVIEGCDLSGWGRIEDDGWGHEQDSAIYSAAADLKRVIVQRNLIHHPRGDSNTWKEPRGDSYHPVGPQALCFRDSEGNHVIRYNTIWSDDDHQYNDILGGSANHSARGFPNRDSDIYGNLLSHCWDDAIESEGANCNVRIWGNYSTETFTSVACASTLIGPLYVWRNLCGVIRLAPDEGSGAFLKTGDEMGGGRVFVFHNTVLQPATSTEQARPPWARTRVLGAIRCSTSPAATIFCTPGRWPSVTAPRTRPATMIMTCTPANSGPRTGTKRTESKANRSMPTATE